MVTYLFRGSAAQPLMFLLELSEVKIVSTLTPQRFNRLRRRRKYALRGGWPNLGDTTFSSKPQNKIGLARLKMLQSFHNFQLPDFIVLTAHRGRLPPFH